MHIILCQILQVFLDEVNTSSCLGLFKEIIVDRTLDGKVSGLGRHMIYSYTKNSSADISIIYNGLDSVLNVCA